MRATLCFSPFKFIVLIGVSAPFFASTSTPFVPSFLDNVSLTWPARAAPTVESDCASYAVEAPTASGFEAATLSPIHADVVNTRTADRNSPDAIAFTVTGVLIGISFGAKFSVLYPQDTRIKCEKLLKPE